jgi:ABC-2 type transport system permease protein
MLGQILTIARNTFVESIRQPVFILLVLICGVAQLFNTWGAGFSMGISDSAEVSGDNKLLLDIGLSTVFVCGTLLAAFIATAVISREIENRTILTVVSKPVARPTVVIGKYVGVSGAILIAVITMLLFLLMGVRHGVMSTASDLLDGPVLVFSFAAVGLAVLLGAWCNYLYGWPFSQTAVLLLLPFMILAYILVLLLNKEWAFQPISKDFKPQITLACYALTLAILVLTAVAIAASTRLGQVMTIVVCSGVFLFGLLSNYFLGQYAYVNKSIGVIKEATPAHTTQALFRALGDTYTITLEGDPDLSMRPGTSFYYGASPNGSDLAVPAFPAFAGDPSRTEDLRGEQTPPAIVVTQRQGRDLTIQNIGGRPLGIRRAPRAGDYVFVTPTQRNTAAAAIWSALPNMQYFWLLDAISQNTKIPLSHVRMLTGYALAQIAAFLALGTVLFQKRDVG